MSEFNLGSIVTGPIEGHPEAIQSVHRSNMLPIFGVALSVLGGATWYAIWRQQQASQAEAAYSASLATGTAHKVGNWFESSTPLTIGRVVVKAGTPLYAGAREFAPGAYPDGEGMVGSISSSVKVKDPVLFSRKGGDVWLAFETTTQAKGELTYSEIASKLDIIDFTQAERAKQAYASGPLTTFENGSISSNGTILNPQGERAAYAVPDPSIKPAP